MLEVLALCAGCACVSCLGCAIATALTCPRISNVISPQCQEPGNCYEWNSCNHGMNYSGNIPHHPVIIFPMEYPSCINWNFRPSISSSASALQSPSITGSCSSSTTDNSCTSLGSKVPLRGNESVGNIPDEVLSAPNGAAKSQEEVENESRQGEFSPTPPPRLKRNRVRSVLKSKLKKRATEIRNFSNSMQKSFEFHRGSGAAGYSPDEFCAKYK